MDARIDKMKFMRNWTFLNAAFFVIGYILLLLFSVIMMASIDLPKDEWGSPLLQTVWQIGNGILFGSSIGFIQWRLLRKTFSVPKSWILLVPTGIIITELIVGIFLSRMGLNRGEFTFWENNPLPHALIASIYGLVIGLIQFPLIRKQFSRSSFWIVASTLAWGASILITAINVTNDIFLLITFIIGILLYGFITGSVFIWILKPRVRKKQKLE